MRAGEGMEELQFVLRLGTVWLIRANDQVDGTPAAP